jgi:hypothetical protein
MSVQSLKGPTEGTGGAVSVARVELEGGRKGIRIYRALNIERSTL